MFGNTKIFFGKIVNVSDGLKLNRCQISIDGLTNEIISSDLPWYFPWYGLNYLPIINDVVSVIVFDDNFVTCFYGRKIDLKDIELSSDDYENYLEIFKRSIDDKNIALTYLKSKGIQFINDKNQIQIELDKLSLFVDTNSIVVTKDKITIGDKNQEPIILGDKGVEHLHSIITHQANTITEMIKLFNVIANACTSPYTASIGVALTANIPTSQTKLVSENKQVDIKADKIQSKKTFIE
jgi:hypothetical protein